MTAQIIKFPIDALEARINAHFQSKKLPFAARYVSAADHTVDDEYILTHNGVPTGLTIQLEPGGEYIAIMETGDDDPEGSNGFWLMQHSEYRRDSVTSMASFFTKLGVLLKAHVTAVTARG